MATARAMPPPPIAFGVPSLLLTSRLVLTTSSTSSRDPCRRCRHSHLPNFPRVAARSRPYLCATVGSSLPAAPRPHPTSSAPSTPCDERQAPSTLASKATPPRQQPGRVEQTRSAPRLAAGILVVSASAAFLARTRASSPSPDGNRVGDGIGGSGLGVDEDRYEGVRLAKDRYTSQNGTVEGSTAAPVTADDFLDDVDYDEDSSPFGASRADAASGATAAADNEPAIDVAALFGGSRAEWDSPAEPPPSQHQPQPDYVAGGGANIAPGASDTSTVYSYSFKTARRASETVSEPSKPLGKSPSPSPPPPPPTRSPPSQPSPRTPQGVQQPQAMSAPAVLRAAMRAPFFVLSELVVPTAEVLVLLWYDIKAIIIDAVLDRDSGYFLPEAVLQDDEFTRSVGYDASDSGSSAYDDGGRADSGEWKWDARKDFIGAENALSEEEKQVLKLQRTTENIMNGVQDSVKRILGLFSG